VLKQVHAGLPVGATMTTRTLLALASISVWLFVWLLALPTPISAQTVPAREAERQLRAAFPGDSADLGSCVQLEPADAPVDGVLALDLKIARDGSVGLIALSVPRPMGFARVAACIANLLPSVSPVAAPRLVHMRVHFHVPARPPPPPPPPLPPPQPPFDPSTLPVADGTRGAVCAWVSPQLGWPAPSPCRAPLECCEGGGAGPTDATCEPPPCLPRP